VITRIVGLLHEHLVVLGHQSSLAALGLAEQDGGGLYRSVPVGTVLKCLRHACWILHGCGDMGGVSEMEKGPRCKHLYTCVGSTPCMGDGGTAWLDNVLPYGHPSIQWPG
jgi:hypothetical protein